MPELDDTAPKRPGIGTLLLLSLVLFVAGPIISETIRWSNHFSGFLNGLVDSIFTAIAWCVVVIPWSLIIWSLYKKFSWKRYRAFWVLAPSIVMLLVSLGSQLVNPPTATARFKNFAKTELPKNVQNLHSHFSGGGIADYNITYYFETTPEEVDRLISEMNLEEESAGGSYSPQRPPVAVLPDCPDYTTWPNSKIYQHYTGKSWFFYLITDATKTKVYIGMLSI